MNAEDRRYWVTQIWRCRSSLETPLWRCIWASIVVLVMDEYRATGPHDLVINEVPVATGWETSFPHSDFPTGSQWSTIHVQGLRWQMHVDCSL